MRRLLIDTGVLLDLTILELSEDGFQSRAYSRMRGALARIDSPTKRARLLDYIHKERVGEFEVSTGVLLEMDRHAQRELVHGNRAHADLAPMEDFWAGYERLRKRLRFRMLPLAWKARSERERLGVGPVDAEQLALLAEDRQRWFVTFDGLLESRALEVAPGRVVPFADVIDG